ncbi:MAG: hypothetical protein AB7P76_04180 [Candidatus Melainabacteria bacterium]
MSDMNIRIRVPDTTTASSARVETKAAEKSIEKQQVQQVQAQQIARSQSDRPEFSQSVFRGNTSQVAGSGVLKSRQAGNSSPFQLSETEADSVFEDDLNEFNALASKLNARDKAALMAAFGAGNPFSDME